jgi:hypothetical protein
MCKRGARRPSKGKGLFYLPGIVECTEFPIKLAPKLEIGEAVPLFTISLEARAASQIKLRFGKIRGNRVRRVET